MGQGSFGNSKQENPVNMSKGQFTEEIDNLPNLSDPINGLYSQEKFREAKTILDMPNVTADLPMLKAQKQQKTKEKIASTKKDFSIYDELISDNIYIDRDLEVWKREDPGFRKSRGLDSALVIENLTSF